MHKHPKTEETQTLQMQHHQQVVVGPAAGVCVYAYVCACAHTCVCAVYEERHHRERSAFLAFMQKGALNVCVYACVCVCAACRARNDARCLFHGKGGKCFFFSTTVAEWPRAQKGGDAEGSVGVALTELAGMRPFCRRVDCSLLLLFFRRDGKQRGMWGLQLGR